MHKPLVDADTATKHLLRNLGDAASLRTNPLVAHFFVRPGDGEECAALERLRHALQTIAERSFRADGAGRASVHLERQRAIFLRCDLAGEPHKLVQNDLALERRQFYRERQRARSRLARALLSLVPAHTESIAVDVDAFGLGLTHARALQAAGDGEQALACARRLLRETVHGPRRIELLCLLADLHAEHADEEKGRESLARARALKLDDDTRVDARIALSESHLAWLEGRIVRASGSAERAIAQLRTLGLQRSARDDEMLASAHLQASISHHMLGAYDEALASLQAAREIVDRRPDLPPRLTVEVLYHLGGAHAVMPGCGAFAESHLTRAFELATRHNLVREVANAALNLANLYLVLGELPRSIEVGRNGIAIAERVLGPSAYAWSALSLASVELAAGNVSRAVELARAGRRSSSPDHLRAALSNVIEADALLRQARPAAAHELVSAAIATLDAAENGRFLGYALRITSEAAHRLGRTTAARSAIDASLGLLERYGHPFSLASALRCSAVITGDRRRLRDADDLLATIRAR